MLQDDTVESQHMDDTEFNVESQHMDDTDIDGKHIGTHLCNTVLNN